MIDGPAPQNAGAVAAPYLPRRVAALFLLLLGAAALACSSNDDAPRGRVLLVGIDGASLRVIRQLSDENRLPNLQRIAHDGVHGPLTAHFPLWSPRIWTSIATGKQPKHHGILGFVKKTPEQRQLLYRSSDRQAHALWNIASDAGLTVAVVNWWTSYPPEVVNGIMISDHAIPSTSEMRRMMHQAQPADESAPVVYPASWQPRVRDVLAGAHGLTDIGNPFEGDTSFPSWVKVFPLNRQFAEDDQVTRLALEVHSELHPDLLMVFLPGIDRISHWLWGNLEPSDRYPEALRPTDSERSAGAAALLEYYVYTDALIGKLLEGYSQDDLVMVVSDHGFEAGVAFEHLTGVHETEEARDGLIFAAGPGITQASRARGAVGAVSVNDVTPTILGWLGLPVASDMDGLPAWFLETAPVQAIASYDTTPIQRLEGATTGAEDEMLDRLRKLGYIE